MKVITPGLTREQREAARDAERAAAWYCNTTLVCDRCGQAMRLEPADFRTPRSDTPYGTLAHDHEDGDVYVMCPNCRYSRWYSEPHARPRIPWGVVICCLILALVIAAIAFPTIMYNTR